MQTLQQQKVPPGPRAAAAQRRPAADRRWSRAARTSCAWPVVGSLGHKQEVFQHEEEEEEHNSLQWEEDKEKSLKQNKTFLIPDFSLTPWPRPYPSGHTCADSADSARCVREAACRGRTGSVPESLDPALQICTSVLSCWAAAAVRGTPSTTEASSWSWPRPPSQTTDQTPSNPLRPPQTPQGSQEFLRRRVSQCFTHMWAVLDRQVTSSSGSFRATPTSSQSDLLSGCFQDQSRWSQQFPTQIKVTFVFLLPNLETSVWVKAFIFCLSLWSFYSLRLFSKNCLFLSLQTQTVWKKQPQKVLYFSFLARFAFYFICFVILFDYLDFLVWWMNEINFIKKEPSQHKLWGDVS